MITFSEAALPATLATTPLTCLHASSASSADAVTPVPIAQIGS